MNGTTAETLLRAEDLSFAYKTSAGLLTRYEQNVVHEVSFTLNRGERLGVVGRNGEGKSTLLRLLAGIITPDAGSIWRAPGIRSSLLALGVGFNGFLTGRDNAILAGVLMGRSERWAKGRLDEIKDFAELGDAFERPVRTYSAGMKARLGFSAALTMDVDVLLIDEVLAVGDAYFRRKATEALTTKLTDGQTVVLVSHSSSDIKRLCNSAIWLEGGEIVRRGTADEVVDAYDQSL